MANILGYITIDTGAVLTVDANPNSGGGTDAPIGALAEYDDGINGHVYIHASSSLTDWQEVSTSATTGSVNTGVAGRLAVYPSNGNSVDDIYSQNSQNIDVNVVAQPTRSAPIEYTIPNPGDAVSAASFVLTEGVQTINGNKTFGNDVVISGDLTVNGSLVSLNTTNTDIKDKLITLNKGGAASSAGGSGIEFEENSVITAYFKINSAETGFSLKSPTIASFADFLTSSLTGNRQYTLPDTTGTLVARPNATPGVSTQVAFFSDANNIVSDAGMTYASGSARLTTTNLTVTNSPTISAFGAGVVHSNASGLLSSSAVVLTSEVSGILPIANGGTNSSTALNNKRIMVSVSGSIVEAAALTDGQLLIGSTGNSPVASAITGTTNQVNISNGPGTITLSTPQDIHTGATPTFAGETLSGAGAFLEIVDAADMKITTATVNTTNGTVTTIATIATTTDTVTLIEAKITGRRTGGTGGTAGDSAAYIRTARVKNVGGTVTLLNLQSDYTSEDQPGFNGNIVVSGTNILVQVQGTANNNLTWKSVITKIA